MIFVMKTSILIIAHNEERYIEECIRSLLRQTQQPDEIVLIVHNSTDRTLEIAQKYPIQITSFSGANGIVNARTEGLKHITGNLILCIDGDSYAKENWVSVMTETLQKENVLVGSWVKFKGTFFGQITSILNKYFYHSIGKRATTQIWGSSFAFWGKDKRKVIDIYKKSVELSKELNLSRNPEDYWLALFMNKKGKIEVTNKTYVTTNSKEETSLEAFKRRRENVKNGIKMRNFFNKSLHML